MTLQRIVKTAQAERDLDDIWFYIAQDNNAAADALLDAFDKQCHLLAEQPMMGRARPDLSLNLRSFPIDSYVVFYIPSVNGIEIIRVLHSARDMGELFHD
jgi:toxin ParE1/3/4